MATEYLMPKLAMAMNEGTIAQWIAQEGDHLNAGDPIMVVETEKVAYDLESPASGYLHITIGEGETVPVDSPIAMLAEDEAELAALQTGGSSAPFG